VLRLPDADDARIRLELAGNLCRCTGYAGIVRAIRRVLLEAPAAAATRPAPLPTISSPMPLQPNSPDAEQAVAHRASDGRTRVEQHLRLSLPRDTVWQALQDPALVAGCIPGASLTGVDGSRVSGAMETALGPIRARFTGAATLTYADDFTGQIAGDGQDGATRLSGQARFAVAADGADASTLDLSIDYALRGPLAQFARGAVVQDFAAEIAGLFARNLEAMLQGRTVAPARRLGLLGLLWRVLRRRFGMTAR